MDLMCYPGVCGDIRADTIPGRMKENSEQRILILQFSGGLQDARYKLQEFKQYSRYLHTEIFVLDKQSNV